MNTIDRVKEITERFSRNTAGRAVLDKFFSPEFVDWANGRKGDLRNYAAHLSGYRGTYEHFSIPAWDELFAAEDRVVAADALEAKRTDGRGEQIRAMPVWQFKNGKGTSLCEVDGH